MKEEKCSFKAASNPQKMTAEIIDGKKLAEGIRLETAKRVRELAAIHGKTPQLAVVLVGENPASKVYIERKNVACGKTGIRTKTIRLPETASQEEVLEEVRRLNEDRDVHGVLVQLPLPKQVSEQAVLEAVDPQKDVDGFHPLSVGGLWSSRRGREAQGFAPATPSGVLKLVESTGVELEGKHAVVVGRSNIVGKPVACLLLRKNCTITVCHRHTRDLASHTREADVLVVAVGKPGLVTGDMVKQGAIVVDVGITRTPEGIQGDVAFDEVKEKASFITPVPGGVGPMTIAMLLENVVKAFELQTRAER